MKALFLTHVLLFVVLFGTGGQSQAAIISVQGDPGDGVVDVNGAASSLADSMIRVGVGGNNVRGHATVFIFSLPTLPFRSALVGAEIELEYLGISQFTVTVAPEFSADLFGIGARATPTIIGTDYYDGDSLFSTDSLLAEGFIGPSSIPGIIEESGSDLLDFVRSLYALGGTPLASYAVFRVNPDKDLPAFSGPYRGFELGSADNSSFAPQLNLTIVPEPSTWLMFLAYTASLASYRLRFRTRGQVAS